MIAGDQVRVTVFVAVEPKDAFEVFTQETELWWGKGPRYRASALGTIAFEPGVGGRLLERLEPPGGPQLVPLGRITTWDPPRRLVFDWRGINFAPDEKTEVEVTFTAVEGGTNVVVCHRGWAALPDDHPVRHGRPVAAFVRELGGFWSHLLSSLRLHAGR